MAAIMVGVFGAFYGFEQFKQAMIGKMFSVKPPPSPVAVVKAPLAPVPRYLDGIGTVRAVHQVTISPEAQRPGGEDHVRIGRRR